SRGRKRRRLGERQNRSLFGACLERYPHKPLTRVLREVKGGTSKREKLENPKNLARGLYEHSPRQQGRAYRYESVIVNANVCQPRSTTKSGVTMVLPPKLAFS